MTNRAGAALAFQRTRQGSTDAALLVVAGDDAARKATELRQQSQASASEPQAAQEEPRSYLKQLLTPYRVRWAGPTGLLPESPYIPARAGAAVCAPPPQTV